MKLVSVNVAKPRTVSWQGRKVRTGIFKEPVAGQVRVAKLNLEGDGQADLRVHGGVDKAVYAFPAEHYAAWSSALGRALPFGQFGENLTVEGMLENAVRIGDRYRIGTAMFEVSQPRTPCFKLGIKMEDDWFPARFLQSGHSGFYLRVLEEGSLQAGDAIHLQSAAHDSLTVLAVNRLLYFEPLDPAGLRTAAELPALSPSWRGQMRRKLSMTEG
jgi:MOSC domain-containing protein YiiM